MDVALECVRALEFNALVYDFAPVAFTPEGDVINPSVIVPRNTPVDMVDLWCGSGLYQIDPVQNLALRTAKPFSWSYLSGETSPISPLLNAGTKRVTEYLESNGLARGVTVPLRGTRGGAATLTGFWDVEFSKPPVERMSAFTYVALLLHTRLEASFSQADLTSTAVDLTPRERECITMSAQGFSAKQIAHRLQRSESTIIMHLQSATRKLGARNRAQAIARAAHYRLLH